MNANPIATATCVNVSAARKTTCPNCGKRLVIPTNLLGKHDFAACPACDHSVDIRTAAPPAVVHLDTEPVISSTSAITNHETQPIAVASPLERRRFRTSSQIAVAFAAAFLMILGSLSAILPRKEIPEASAAPTKNEHIELAETKVMNAQIDDANRAQQQLDETNREIQRLQVEIQAAEREQKALELEIEQLERDTI